MKHILLFGAGKSATVLIQYLKTIATKYQWTVTVADNDIRLAESKVGEHDLVKAIQLNIEDATARKACISKATVVISMLPPALHYLIALDCIEYSKHLLTASYVDEKNKNHELSIKNCGVLFLCEMGLDPGIDHMSAMQLIHQIKEKGGQITSFKSHCGGLVAPECDTNPWHYKISWNPHNVVLAGKAGAVYKVQQQIVSKSYAELFNECAVVDVEGLGQLAYYPNRDSLSYIPLYALQNAETFVRTTLRYPAFCEGWKYVVAWKLTDEEKKYQTNHLSIASFFQQHFESNGLTDAYKIIQSNNLLQKQFENLGLNDAETLINKGICSAADVLQFILETKWALLNSDKDMIVMLHEVEYLLNNVKHKINSTLIVKGDDSLHTAMAKTVGLPLGIAAKLILEGKLTETGLHIPIIPAIYTPVLHELSQHGIAFSETETTMA